MNKNENQNNEVFLCCGVWPRTLQFTSNSYDFRNKKGALLGVIWAPSWTLILPKPYFFMFFDDFGGLICAPQKSTKRARRKSKMASSRPVLAPDGRIVHTHSHMYAKKVANVKPPRYLKVSLSAQGFLRPSYKARDALQKHSVFRPPQNIRSWGPSGLFHWESNEEIHANGLGIRFRLMAVSHQFPSGNQDRNRFHRKVCFWAVFIWFWLSFGLIRLSLMGVMFVDCNRC